MLQPRSALRGWVEVLFQRQPFPVRFFKDIQPEKYSMVGSAISLQEIDCLSDVYYMLHRGDLSLIPRAPQHGDLLNLCRQPHILKTFMITCPTRLKAAFKEQLCVKIDIDPTVAPMGLMRLPFEMPTFAADQP